MTMTKAEVIEEIRALVREPQEATVDNPWNYAEAELITQVRSALRHLRVFGINVQGSIDEQGEFVSLPTESEGVMIALFVAERLISGDLIQKLLDGELGIYLNAGGDVIDTKTATTAFRDAAKNLRARLDGLTGVALATNPSPNMVGAALFGGPTPYMA